MKRKLLTFFVVISIAVGLIPASAVHVAAGTPTHKPVTNYLQDTDHIVISPAENWSSNGIRQTLTNTGGWCLTIQNNNTFNGDDLQMWQFGVSDKLRVWDYDKGAEKGLFKFHAINWREETSGRYVDVDGQRTNAGANIHVWKSAKDNKAKWFGLEEDYDSDPETFFIFNKNSGLYLAPEGYFNSKKQCLKKGTNTVLSEEPFHWRIEVINRTPSSVANQREWMSKLPGSVYLSNINIPGTHDSATANIEGSWNEGYNAVACQKYFINELLNVGARAFDLRMRYKDDGQPKDTDRLVMVHGNEDWAVCHYSAFLGKSSKNGEFNMTFDSVMNDLKTFLKDHPRETAIIICRSNGGNEATTTQYYKKVMDNYKSILYNWSKKDPTLDDVRGKVVAFSCMSGCTGGIYGIDISKWDYSDSRNKYAQLINSGGSPKVYVQDNYVSTTINKKTYFYDTVRNLNGDTKDEAAPGKDAFVFNFSSYNWGAIFVTPLVAARDMNGYILDDSNDLYKNYISKKKRLGIVMMDYVDENLCKRIYQANIYQ